ncbi:MAG: phage tail protein [Bacteroidota bacterium]
MAKRTLPPVGFRFNVNFFYSDGSPFTERNGSDACFQSVSGISVEYETETVNEGANTRNNQKLPKKPTFPNLVLKRGILLDSAILNWLNLTTLNSQVEFEPLDVEVNLMNDEGDTLFNVRFVGAWPSKWSISDFNAMESGLVMETLELTYKYFRFIK